MLPPPAPVIVLAAIGADPAPLVQLVWGLVRHRNLRIERAFVVVDRRGLHYLENEALAPTAVWQQLRRALGDDAVPSARDLDVVKVLLPDGSLLEDDDLPEQAAVYNETVWQAAQHAIRAAGPKPTVFALTAGRRRTMHVAATVAFQLLARPHDLFVDVRPTNKDAAHPGGFFFPEQSPEVISTRFGPVLAGNVGIDIIDVLAPRLRGLIGDFHPRTFHDAIRAGQAAIDDAAPPHLVIDFPSGRVLADGTEVPLTKARFLWYATLAVEREMKSSGDGWVVVRSQTRLWEIARRCARMPWPADAGGEFLGQLMCMPTPPDDDTNKDDESLRKLRSDTKASVAAFCRTRKRLSRWLVPVHKASKIDGCLTTLQRLPLEPAFIELRWD